MEIAASAQRHEGDEVIFVYPGGFIGHRKPVKEVVEAFMRTLDPSSRLLVTAQVDRKRLDAVKEMVAGDDRIELVLDDLPRLEHLARIASCDVCVTPSRWEGLGLPLYEATAFGQPIVVNDNPPMNEVVTDGDNGLLVAGIKDGTAKSGIPAFSPDVAELARAFDRLADPELRAQLAEGSRRLPRGALLVAHRRRVPRHPSRPANLRGFMNEKALTPAPFVVGVGRSGTTMLRLMLDAHPELTIPPETHFVPDLIGMFEEGGATPDGVYTRLAEDRRWEDFHLDADALHQRLHATDPFEVAPVAARLLRALRGEGGQAALG